MRCLSGGRFDPLPDCTSRVSFPSSFELEGPMPCSRNKMSVEIRPIVEHVHAMDATAEDQDNQWVGNCAAWLQHPQSRTHYGVGPHHEP